MREEGPQLTHGCSSPYFGSPRPSKVQLHLDRLHGAAQVQSMQSPPQQQPLRNCRTADAPG